MFFFVKQKTAYEMRISDWSSDVCSSDLVRRNPSFPHGDHQYPPRPVLLVLLLASTVTGCASTATDGRVFDYVAPVANAAAVANLEVKGQTEKNGRASCRERVCQYV